MSNLSTLPKGDSAWLLRKAIERIIQQVSVLETNIGSSTTGNSANTQVIFNDAGTLRGDAAFVFDAATDMLSVTGFKTFLTTQLSTIGTLYVGTIAAPKLKVDVAGTGITTIAQATITGAATVGTTLGVTGQSTLTGNVGVGVTPTAWGVGTKALQVGSTAFGSLFDFLTDFVAVTANLHWTGANYGRMSASSKFATAYYQEIATGAHQWLSSTAAGTNVVAPTMVANMTLDASGNLSIGNAKYIAWGNADSLIFGDSSANYIYFRTNATEQVRIDSSGNVNVKNGNVVIGTSGKGIDFSASSNAAGATSELLNDYEEGTFTPTVVGSTTAGTATYSAGAQNGYYTKVGRLVTVQVYMVWSGHTGTGNMRFAGLPFNTANITSNYASVSFGLVSNIALTANNILTGHTELNNSFINALQTPAGGGAYTLVPIDASGEVLFTCSYIAA